MTISMSQIELEMIKNNFEGMRRPTNEALGEKIKAADGVRKSPPTDTVLKNKWQLISGN